MTLHVSVTGQGPELVLVHGWGLHGGVWQPVLETLARDFRVTVVDLPGHGRSALEDEFTLESVIEQLLAVTPARACWLGWSLGGLLSLALAAREPSRVARLLLVASSPRFIQGAHWPHAMPPEVMAQFGRELSEDFTGTLKRFLALVARGAEAGTSPLRLLRDKAMQYPPQPVALAGGMQLLMETDLLETLGEIRCPVMLVLGQRDTLVPVDSGAAVCARLADCRLEIITGAGHAPFLSHPRAFMGAVRDFAA